MSEPVSAIDGAALIAALRRQDEGAVARAYQVTFGNDIGRFVLAHHLAECGVGNALMGPENDHLEYRAGKHDGALLLASKAGVDQPAIAVAVLTDTLEENRDAELERNPYPPLDDEDFG